MQCKKTRERGARDDRPSQHGLHQHGADDGQPAADGRSENVLRLINDHLNRQGRRQNPGKFAPIAIVEVDAKARNHPRRVPIPTGHGGSHSSFQCRLVSYGGVQRAHRHGELVPTPTRRTKGNRREVAPRPVPRSGTGAAEGRKNAILSRSQSDSDPSKKILALNSPARISWLRNSF